MGQHPAAVSYALSTVAAARVAGAVIDVERYEEATAQETLLARIRRLNADALGGFNMHLEVMSPILLKSTQVLRAMGPETAV